MDRRIRKTQEAIMDAFVGLMAEKDFEQITINDIADRADVNRGTVYLHYTDKFDLLDQCIDTYLAQLLASCVDSDNPDFPSKTSLIRAFKYLEQNTFFYNALRANKGFPAFRTRLMAVLVSNLNEQIDRNNITLDLNKEVSVQFLASAISGIVEWWITSSMPYPAAEMADQLWLLFEQMRVASTAN